MCHAYLASNLLYHTYLEPVPKAVDKDYQGLEQKLRAHARSEAKELLIVALLCFQQPYKYNFTGMILE